MGEKKKKKSATQHSSQCGSEMVPFVRDELQHVGVGILAFSDGRRRAEGKEGQEKEEGELTCKYQSEPDTRLCIIRSNPPLPSPPLRTPLHIVVLACLGE